MTEYNSMVTRLMEARAKIESGWTRGAYARDAAGNRTDNERGPDAASWCAVGAMHAVAPDGFESITNSHPLYLAAKAIGENSISAFNDAKSTTKQDVLALYDRAISIAIGSQ